jgi:hypothetical protein
MTTQTTKRLRRTTAAAVAGALALTGLGVACDRSGDQVPGPSSTATSPPEATIKQARWDFRVRPSAVLSKRLHRKEKRRLLRQRGPLKRTVKEVYDALFLDPPSARSVIVRRFAGNASRAWLATKAGFRSGATDVKTLKRAAEIGIDAFSGRRAAAKVFIRARASVDGEKVKMKHRSTLWLERVRGRWVAIGFQVKQEPLA